MVCSWFNLSDYIVRYIVLWIFSIPSITLLYTFFSFWLCITDINYKVYVRFINRIHRNGSIFKIYFRVYA